jgi:hypothetical protein
MALKIHYPTPEDYWPQIAGPKPRRRPQWLSNEELLARVSETLRRHVERVRG